MQLQTNDFSYADKVNAQFNRSSSHYVSIGERLKSVTEPSAWKASIVEDAVNEFRIRHPEINSWKDIRFCKALHTTIDKLDIDVTLQRLYDLYHCTGIVDNFKQVLIKPIFVYVDPSRPDRYICWDGQHTAIALFIIAILALNEKIANCSIPIVITDSTQKSEIREALISHATTASKPFDQIDIFQQSVFGVRTDHSTNPEWVITEKKQVALEGARMFATNCKFNDTQEAGALTVLTELMNTDLYELSETQNFCKYFVRVCKSQRPVQPKESWMLYEYFRACRLSGISLTDEYIREVATSLKTVTGNDFDSALFYRTAKQSYQEWYRKKFQAADGSIRGISYPEKRIGLTFLVAQIKKGISKKGLAVPKINDLWPVPHKDLF